MILTDGCELELLEGLRVSDNQTVNIYAQSGGSGKLTCSASGGNAAIGGSEGENGGTVVVHGGSIKSKAGGTYSLRSRSCASLS